MASEYLYHGIWNKKDNSVFFLAQGIDESKEYEHTLIYFDNKKEWLLDKYFPWDSASIDTDLNDNIIVIGADGDFAVRHEDSYEEGRISEYPTITGSYRSDSALYIVGMSSAIYHYNNDMKWTLINSGVGSNEDFSSMHGNSQTTFIVGFKGVCYQRNKENWEEEPLPTNENLKSVFVSDDGFIFIVGQNGILLVGGNGSWHIINHDYMLDDLWLVKSFEDIVYVAGNNIIYELALKDSEWNLAPIYSWDIEKNGIFSDLFFENGNRKRIWVMSEKGLAYMQGDVWDRLY